MSTKAIQATAKTQDTQTMAAVKAHDTERRSETQIQVAEISAAGKIIDSRADRDHESHMTAHELLHGADQAEKQRNFEAWQSEQDRTLAAQQAAQKPNGNAS